MKKLITALLLLILLVQLGSVTIINHRILAHKILVLSNIQYETPLVSDIQLPPLATVQPSKYYNSSLAILASSERSPFSKVICAKISCPCNLSTK